MVMIGCLRSSGENKVKHTLSYPQGDRLTMPHISAKPHRERIVRAELGRHLCSAQWLNTWTCENGLQQCGAWSGRPQGSPRAQLGEATDSERSGRPVEGERLRGAAC